MITLLDGTTAYNLIKSVCTLMDESCNKLVSEKEHIVKWVCRQILVYLFEPLITRLFAKLGKEKKFTVIIQFKSSNQDYLHTFFNTNNCQVCHYIRLILLIFILPFYHGYFNGIQAFHWNIFLNVSIEESRN